MHSISRAWSIAQGRQDAADRPPHPPTLPRLQPRLLHSTRRCSVATQHSSLACRIGEAGACAIAAALAHSTRLTALSLSRTALGTSGAAAVGSALQHNAGLRRLDLAGNGAAAAAGLMLGRALARHPHLSSLDLSGNPLGATGGLAVLRAAVATGTVRDLALHRCHFAAGSGASCIDTFNPESPNGEYRLDLAGVDLNGRTALWLPVY